MFNIMKKSFQKKRKKIFKILNIYFKKMKHILRTIKIFEIISSGTFSHKISTVICPDVLLQVLLVISILKNDIFLYSIYSATFLLKLA